MTVTHDDPHVTHGPLPLLRHRDGGDDLVFEHPISVVGHVIHLDFDTVTISGGRGSFTEIYLEDLYDLLDGPQMAMSLFLDAAEHNDEVHIKLAPEGLTYSNPAQQARLEKVVAAG
jgi:hypothetical protein